VTSSRTLAIIPARGGSKGIPRKNVKPLGGRPLIGYTIDAAIGASRVDRTIVTTDDDEIATVAEREGADVPFLRPAELAEDETPTEPVVSHALETVEGTYGQFVLLQPTSPLRTAIHVEEALERYHATGATSLLSVYGTHEYRWVETETGAGAKQINYEGERGRRQDQDPECVENGAIYITDVEAYLDTSDFMTGKTVLYEMRKRESIDIDVPFDLWLTEKIMRYERANEE
jgi:CMP-N-acetylneuraminic acid synthetase